MATMIETRILEEISKSDEHLNSGDFEGAFFFLERAHVLGQSSTFHHTRIHLRMLKLGWKCRKVVEIFGQIIRVVGAATKTPFGIYPIGNTGGANVWFFKPMPIPDDLQKVLDEAKPN